MKRYFKNALGMVYLKTVATYSISSGLKRGSATLSILTPLKMFVVGKLYCLVFEYIISINILQCFLMLHGFHIVNPLGKKVMLYT